jgi:hypothetical protein
MTTTPFNETRSVEQIKAELRARDEFEQAKAARGRELEAELTARAAAKTHERYLAGGDPPAKLIGLTDAGKRVLELERRIDRAITVAEGSKYDDDEELISGFDDIINILRGEEA